MITTMGKRGPTPAPRGHSPIAPRAPGSNQQRGTGAESWASSAAVVAVTDVRAIWDELAPDLQRRGYSRRGTPRPSGACCDAAARRAVEHLEAEGEVVEQAVMVIVCTPRSPRPAGRLPAGAGGESPDAPRHCETRRSTRTNYAATKQTNETKATMSPLPHNAIRYCPTAVP